MKWKLTWKHLHDDLPGDECLDLDGRYNTIQLESSFGENDIASHYITQKSEGFAWSLGVGVTPVWTYVTRTGPPKK